MEQHCALQDLRGTSDWVHCLVALTGAFWFCCDLSLPVILRWSLCSSCLLCALSECEASGRLSLEFSCTLQGLAASAKSSVWSSLSRSTCSRRWALRLLEAAQLRQQHALRTLWSSSPTGSCGQWCLGRTSRQIRKDFSGVTSMTVKGNLQVCFKFGV